MVSLVFLVLVLLVAIFAPWLAPQDPNRASALDILASPSSEHWLGADGSGHDIFSRLIVATRTSVAAALVALVVAAVIGISSRAGGRLLRPQAGRASFSWVASLLMALPAIVVLLAARAVLGPSIWMIMVIFGILVSPAFYRVVYGAVTGVRHELYVDAARVFGLSDARIIGRHILSVVRAPAIILAAGVAGVSIAVQAGLDFLGLGDLSKPSWGGMLNDAFANIYTKPINLLWPSLAIGLTCIALALFGNALRDELERSAAAPKRRRQARGGARPLRSRCSVSRSSCTTSCPARAERRGAAPVRHLSVGYDQPNGSVKTVVHDVSLTVRRGEVHGLIGESGSGKTQTAFSVMRLLPPGGRITAGHGRVRGHRARVGVGEGDDQAARAARSPTSRRSRCRTSTPPSPSAAS